MPQRSPPLKMVTLGMSVTPLLSVFLFLFLTCICVIDRALGHLSWGNPGWLTGHYNPITPTITVLRWPCVVDKTLKSNYYYYLPAMNTLFLDCKFFPHVTVMVSTLTLVYTVIIKWRSTAPSRWMFLIRSVLSFVFNQKCFKLCITLEGCHKI